MVDTNHKGLVEVTFSNLATAAEPHIHTREAPFRFFRSYEN